MRHVTNLSETLLRHKKKLSFMKTGYSHQIWGIEGGGVLKLVKRLMGVVYGVVYK